MFKRELYYTTTASTQKCYSHYGHEAGWKNDANAPVVRRF